MSKLLFLVLTILVSCISTLTVENRAYAMLNKIITEYSRNMSTSIQYSEFDTTEFFPKLENVTVTNCTLISSGGMQLVKVRNVTPDFKRLEAQVKFPDTNVSCKITRNKQLVHSESSYMKIFDFYSDLIFDHKPDTGGYSVKFRFNENMKVQFVVNADIAFLLPDSLENLASCFIFLMFDHFKDLVPEITKRAKLMNISDKSMKMEVTAMTKIEETKLTTTDLDIEANDFLDDLRNIVQNFNELDSVIYFPDKQIRYKEELGILSITSELDLTDCSLRKSSIKAFDIGDPKHVYDFKITEGRITFPNVTVSCELTILKSGIHWQSRISVTALDTRAELITVENSVITKFKLISEPKIKLIVDDSAVQTLVMKYHLHELSTYLSGLIIDYFKNEVPATFDRLLEIKCK